MTDLGAIRRRHRQATHRVVSQSTGEVAAQSTVCRGCYQPWPCDAADLIGEVERLRKALSDVREVTLYPNDVDAIATEALEETEGGDTKART